MRDTTDVPELGGHQPTGLVDGIGDAAPARHLLGGVDAGGVHVALALGRDLRALADDQSGAGALDVVLPHQVVGDVAGLVGTHPGQWRHHDPVRQLVGAHLQRAQQWGGHVAHCPGLGSRA